MILNSDALKKDQRADSIASYHVTVTVRSHELGERIVKSYPGYASGYLSYVVVEDISRKGAMDDVRYPHLP
jgi:hypothetical protein